VAGRYSLSVFHAPCTVFTPAPADMLNDLYLGLSVVALGLIIWIVILLIKDPRGIVKATLFKKK